MNVLVTGGTGFIGSHLVEHLCRRGDQMRCLAKDRLNAGLLESLGVEVFLGDINKGSGWERVLDGIECIFYLAGVTRARTPRDYYDGNHLAIKRFLENCTTYRRQLKRFVYISSLASVGPSTGGEPVTEETAYHPVSHYGRSKMLGELEVLKVKSELPITVIRPTSVYGPREREWLEYFRLMKRGIQLLIGFNKKVVNLIYADDLIQGIILAADHPRAIGEVYFLGSDGSYSTQQVGDTIARVMESSRLPVRVPHAIVYTLGAISSTLSRFRDKQVFFNFTRAKELVQDAWICSVEKAKQHLGFRPQVPLSDGLLKTYRWYKENGWL